MWVTLHNLARFVDEEHCAHPNEQLAYVQLFSSLFLLMPCSDCKTHMREYLLAHPFPKPTARAPGAGPFFEFMHAFHNNVNARLGKPTLSLAAARELYAFNDSTECPAEADCDGAPNAPNVPNTSLAAPAATNAAKTKARAGVADPFADPWVPASIGVGIVWLGLLGGVVAHARR